jgi:CubicO group peptidase (beta-lactamase class C family)
MKEYNRMQTASLRARPVAIAFALLLGVACVPRFDYGRTEPLDRPDATRCEGLPSSGTAAAIPAATLDSITRAAVATLSDELVIVRDGRIVHQWRHPDFRDTIFNPQSVTKAVASLGVGLLLDDGRIPSLDLPVREVFPAFDLPEKSAVTLRMLMAHTSGIAADRGERQFGGKGDVQAFVLAQPLAEPPGTVFRYNNLGAQLMGQVVQARSGVPLARLVEERVFRPLCISSWSWDHDARGATYAYSRVRLRAVDLAAIGQLVLDGGDWRGTRVLSRAAIDSLTHIRGARGLSLAPHSFALSWQWAGDDRVIVDSAWRARLEASGPSDTLRALARRLAPDGERRQLLTTAFKAALDTAFASPTRDATLTRWYRESKGMADPERVRGNAQAVFHSGSWGQWLIVFPETRTVVVRYASWEHAGRTDEGDIGAWNSIVGDLYRLIGRRAEQ